MIAYKLMRKRKDGSLGSLFINKRSKIPLRKWLKAETIPTKGFAVRSGFHACLEPNAPHLTKSGRVWCKVKLHQVQEILRPPTQGGIWLVAQKMKVLGEL